MKHLYWFLLLLCSSTLRGQAQTLDPAFQPTKLLNRSPAVRVLALAAQPDGKSLVAGDFQTVGGALSNNVLRLNTDLSRDLSFRPGLGANGPVQVLAVQTDGTILIGGSFTTYAGTVTGPVARLLPTGELDPAFHLDPALTGAGQVAAVVVQADGRILVGGPVSASLPGGLVRLLPTGALDSTFSSGVGAGSGGQVLTLAVQPSDGRIVVGGTFASFNGRLSRSLVRLLPTGSPDADFAPASYLNYRINSVALLPDGSLMVGGQGNLVTPLLQRLLPSGVPDPQFSPKTSGIAWVRTIRVDSRGRVLVAGTFDRYAAQSTSSFSSRDSIIRLLADGTPDPSFLPFVPRLYASLSDYYTSRPDYYAVLPLPNDQLLAGGGVTVIPGVSMLASSPTVGLRLLSAAGVPDANFTLDLQWRGSLRAAVPLANGKLVLTGTYTSLNSQAVAGFWQRLHPDGSLDQDLTLPRYSFPQPDGQVYAVVGGSVCQRGCGTPLEVLIFQNYLRRIRADDTTDPTFNPPVLGAVDLPSQAPAYLQQLLVFPTGEALYGLLNSSFYLARFRPSGALLTSLWYPAFVPGGISDQLLAQPDGKTLVRFHIYTGQSRLIRLLPDGQPDPSFTVDPKLIQPADAAFTTALLQPDGRLLVAGAFTSVAGVATPTGVVRLRSDGSVDASFQPPASLAPLVPLACLPDGRLLVRANSQPGSASLRQLLADGTPDPSFAPVAVTVAGSPVTSWNVVLQPRDQKLVLYGDFDAVAGQPRIGLARLGAATPLAVRAGSGAASFLSLYPNPAHQRATLVLPTALRQASTVQLYDALGREVRREAVPAHATELTLSLNGLLSGLYLVRCGPTTGHLVVE
jgi:uncharacterized delta-60 repeat protein